MAFDEAFAGGDFVTHEHVEGLVGLNGFFDVDFEDGALGGIHGGIPEGFGIHFTETFVATYLGLFAVVLGLVFGYQGIAFLFGVDVEGLLAFANMVERRLGNV